jgi:hypothetical protein
MVRTIQFVTVKPLVSKGFWSWTSADHPTYNIELAHPRYQNVGRHYNTRQVIKESRGWVPFSLPKGLRKSYALQLKEI